MRVGDIYDAGVREGKRESVNKAVEWLENNLPQYWGQLNANDTQEFINNFKKAMEQ